MKKYQTVKHETIFVDFQSKKITKVYSKNIKMKVSEGLDFSNFNPVPEDSNFAAFSPEERMEYSEHILAYIHEASFSDLVHWANMGMIDMKKVDKILKLNQTMKKTKKK